MKILVVSLLRLGDVIQQEVLLRGIKQQHPGAEIHLLLNHQFSQVERLFQNLVAKYHYFRRDEIQKSAGDPHSNVFWAVSQVEKLVAVLNEESYDLAYNFTHNKLSAYMLGALNCKKVYGISHREGGFRGLDNRWLRYFNDRFSGGHLSLFHYVELLSKAFQIPFIHSAEVMPMDRVGRKTILLQCLTSDEKKNWGLDKFSGLKNTIQRALPDYSVRVLGASFERDILLSAFSESDLLIADLADVRQHLQNAALLITGDTSVKHMAAAVGTPIVEVVVGSSDALKTGAYSKKAVIIRSSAPCAPCSHRSPCPYTTHRCADEITVDRVFAAVWDQLSGEKLRNKRFEDTFEKAVWTVYLDRCGQSGQALDSAALKEAAHSIAGETVAEAIPELDAGTFVYVNLVDKIRAALPSKAYLDTKNAVQAADFVDLILCAQDILRSKVDKAGYFQEFVEVLLQKYSHPLQILGRVETVLIEIDELIGIRKILINQIRTNSTEGAYYANGIGQLPISGFDEARRSLSADPEGSRAKSRDREITTP